MIKQKIKASELVVRRHAEALAAMERLITEREKTFQKMGRLTSKLWTLARQVKRYEEGTPQLVVRAPLPRSRRA